jgi:HEAT repeat protein
MLVLAAGCATASPARRQAEEVVWRSLSARDAGERVEATRIVVEVADPALDRGLPARLADPDPTVRALAASALASQSEVAQTQLIAALDGPDAAARVVALDGAGALPDGAERAARLAGDPDEAVRARAGWTLASLRSSLAGAILERLAADERPGVRAEALRALASLGDARAAALAERALADPSLAVRLSALAALARAGGDPARLVALACGGDRFVALRAAVQLGRLGRAPAALSAVEAAASDRRAELREAAMNAAGELGRAGATLAAAHLRDPDLDVRLAAARALLAGTPSRADEARRVLSAALSTPRALDVADELARLGDPRGRAVLAEAARSSDGARRRAALVALASLSPEPAELAGALGDADARVRLTAARAILRRALRPYLR